MRAARMRANPSTVLGPVLRSPCNRQRRLCAVALIDQLTHHAEILSIEGESYRKREAEEAQKRKQQQKPKR